MAKAYDSLTTDPGFESTCHDGCAFGEGALSSYSPSVKTQSRRDCPWPLVACSIAAFLSDHAGEIHFNT